MIRKNKGEIYSFMNKEKNSLKKELESIWIYTESINNNLAKKRIGHLLDWYIRKATFYKKSILYP